MTNVHRFVEFCRVQLRTGDYDAHIPFLAALCRGRGLSRRDAVWLGLLYMAYYSEGSAWVAFTTPGVRKRTAAPPAALPITTQRRNLYGGRIVRHFASLGEISDLSAWVQSARDWAGLLALLGGVYGNGRWACYTTAELLTHLGGLPIEPDCYEITASSGPRRGLRALGLPETDAGAGRARDELTRRLGRGVPYSVLESLLCDWGGVCKGTFYAGRNIDRQQARILQVERLTGRRLPALWAARAAAFPADTLGEVNGWEGIDRPRLKAYRDGGRLPEPHEDR